MKSQWRRNRLTPAKVLVNAVTGKVKSGQKQLSDKATKIVLVELRFGLP
jgi:hypothetical protein